MAWWWLGVGWVVVAVGIALVVGPALQRADRLERARRGGTGQRAVKPRAAPSTLAPNVVALTPLFVDENATGPAGGTGPLRTRSTPRSWSGSPQR